MELLILMLKYITAKGEEETKKFSYVGNNLSLSYEHIWGPFADALLKYVPEWMAPNVLTIAGFLCVVVAHTLIMTSGDFGEPISPVRLFIFGLLLLTYQTLDNLDGKQARRTKSSSPIDCVSSFLIGVSVLKILAVTDKVCIVFIIITHVLSVFFCAMWNQFHTFNFELGMINPVDDGIPTVALLAIGNCFIDHTVWNTDFALKTVNLDVLLFLAVPLSLLLYNINKDIFVLSKHSFRQTAMDLVQPISIIITLILLAVFGPSRFFDEAFYPLLYSIALLWARNINYMQVSFITKSKNNVFNFPFLTFVGGYIGFLILSACGYQFALGMMLLQTVFYLQFVVSVILQMRSILRIHLFDLKYIQ